MGYWQLAVLFFIAWPLIWSQPLAAGTKRKTMGPVSAVSASSFAIKNPGKSPGAPRAPFVTNSEVARRIHDSVIQDAQKAIEQGRETFRFDTYGNETFWGGQLRLHEAVAAALTLNLALELGLKVDLQALPQPLINRLRKGQVNLDDPAVTLDLLRLNAVVGIKGIFGAQNDLTSLGITCSLCHASVDDALAPGIGFRLDGWANRDLNVGAIVALAPNLQFFVDLLGVDDATVRAVLNGWGPGKFDAELALDGKAANDSGILGSSATLIPPAFGLAGVNLHTWTGWGSVTYWNAFVAILEMHGKGTFFDPRLKDAVKFPIAAAAGFDNVRDVPDLVTPKLADLHFYQLALKAPTPPPGSFDQAAAARGEILFKTSKADGGGDCARCHVPPLFTEPGWNMHTPEEIGIDPFQANRSPDERYRTSPLKGLWTHTKGGFFHDGRFGALSEVVEHYNDFFGLGLTPGEIADIVEYLKSL